MPPKTREEIAYGILDQYLEEESERADFLIRVWDIFFAKTEAIRNGIQVDDPDGQKFDNELVNLCKNQEDSWRSLTNARPFLHLCPETLAASVTLKATPYCSPIFVYGYLCNRYDKGKNQIYEAIISLNNKFLALFCELQRTGQAFGMFHGHSDVPFRARKTCSQAFKGFTYLLWLLHQLPEKSVLECDAYKKYINFFSDKNVQDSIIIIYGAVALNSKLTNTPSDANQIEKFSEIAKIWLNETFFRFINCAEMVRRAMNLQCEHDARPVFLSISKLTDHPSVLPQKSPPPTSGQGPDSWGPMQHLVEEDNGSPPPHSRNRRRQKKKVTPPPANSGFEPLDDGDGLSSAMAEFATRNPFAPLDSGGLSSSGSTPPPASPVDISQRRHRQQYREHQCHVINYDVTSIRQQIIASIKSSFPQITPDYRLVNTESIMQILNSSTAQNLYTQAVRLYQLLLATERRETAGLSNIEPTFEFLTTRSIELLVNNERCYFMFFDAIASVLLTMSDDHTVPGRLRRIIWDHNHSSTIINAPYNYHGLSFASAWAICCEQIRLAQSNPVVIIVGRGLEHGHHAVSCGVKAAAQTMGYRMYRTENEGVVKVMKTVP